MRWRTVTPPDAVLEITINLQAGTHYRLQITDSQQRIRDGVTESSVSVANDVSLTVTEEIDGGAVVEWVYGVPSVRNTDDSLDARLAITSAKMLAGQRIVYLTDDKGMVTSLSNSHEVQTLYGEVVERMLSDVDRETNNPVMVSMFRAILEPTRRRTYTEFQALEMPKLFHFFSGKKLNARTSYGQSVVTRLDITGSEVPSSLSYELAWFDLAKQVAWLRRSETADHDRTADEVLAFVRTLVDGAGQRLPRRFNVGSTGVSDEAVYAIDLKTGLPKSVAYTRHIEMLGFSLDLRRQISVIQ